METSVLFNFISKFLFIEESVKESLLLLIYVLIILIVLATIVLFVLLEQVSNS